MQTRVLVTETHDDIIFPIKRNFMKLSLIVLHALKICLLPLTTLKRVTRCRIRRIREYLSKHFTLVLVLAMVWRQNIVEMFLFVLYHRGMLSVGLLNSLKKRGKGRKHFAAVRKEEFISEAMVAVIRNPRGMVLRLAHQCGV
jgi:hypothetical protein